MANQITPCLLYTKNADKAAKYYTSIFPDGKILSTDKMHTMFSIGGQKFLALNGPAQKFNWGVSFMIRCKDQKEVDYYWSRLSKGGKQLPCGWLQDKYGLAWQITPSIMSKLIGAKNREKAGRALAAMMKMKKLDIAKLQAAFDG